MVIFSALGYKDYELWLIKVLKKKLIYIMHGFAEDDSVFLYNKEQKLLPFADLILCVSEPFRQLVANRFPQYKEKLNVLTNGIDWCVMINSISGVEIERQDNEIILVGGGRIIKRNLNVCKAIQMLNKSGYNLHVSVYGCYNENDESQQIKNFPFVSYYGLVSHKELLMAMKKARLFVQASKCESFGLGVVESLICGCDLVVSMNVGVISIISSISSEEIIFDSSDIFEIKQKIENVLRNPNNSRLIDGIDREETSIETSVSKLIDYANNV